MENTGRDKSLELLNDILKANNILKDWNVEVIMPMYERWVTIEA